MTAVSRDGGVSQVQLNAGILARRQHDYRRAATHFAQALCVCLIRLPYVSAATHFAQASCVCLMCLPYTSALYVCLMCLPQPTSRRHHVSALCVCLIRLPYTSALCVCRNPLGAGAGGGRELLRRDLLARPHAGVS